MKQVVRLLLGVGVVVALIASAVPSHAAAGKQDDTQSATAKDQRTIQAQGSSDDSNSTAATDRGTAADTRQGDRGRKFSDPQSVSKRWWWWSSQGQGGNDEDDENDTSPSDEDDE